MPERARTVLWVVLSIAAAFGGYGWGFRLVERALARSVDYSQTVEATFVPDISGTARPQKDPATPFKLLFPPYVRISDTAPVTGSVAGSSSESVRASLDGGRLKVSPEGDVAPTANVWKWTITPTEMGSVFLTAKVRDSQRGGSADTFLAKITVTDEFGFTKTSRQLLRILGALLGIGFVQGLRMKF
jgi:hypothetical protein